MPGCDFIGDHCLVSCPEGECSFCCPPLYRAAPQGTPKHALCYVGIVTPDKSGNMSREGRECGVGCSSSCDEENILAAYLNTEGNRFLRPAQYQGLQNRDARGRLTDLGTNRILLTPSVIFWERAACWSNEGFECFGEEVCRCWGDYGADPAPKDPGIPGEPFLCDGDVTLGQPVVGWIPDRFFVVGGNWPPYEYVGMPHGVIQQSPSIHCRKFQDSRPAAPVLVSGSAPQYDGNLEIGLDPMLGVVAMSTADNRVDEPCSFNLFMCAAKLSPSTKCETALIVTNPFREYYNENLASRLRFEEMHILQNNASFRVQPNADARDAARVRFKNRVLSAIKSASFPVRFDRLDHRVVFDGNIGLGWFFRLFNGEYEIPDVFGPCRLRQSGGLVECRCFVTYVKVSCQMLPIGENANNTNTTPYIRVRPHTRFRIWAELEIRATAPSPLVMRQLWRDDQDPLRATPLSLDNSGKLPRVVPDVDDIIFVGQDGEDFIPDTRVTWWGFLGANSTPSAYQIPGAVNTTPTAGGICGALADSLTGVVVPGFPTHLDTNPEDPNLVYDGSVTLGFPE